MGDSVKAPAHYAGAIEAKDAMRAMSENVDLPPMAVYWWLSAFKYLWRWPKKGGLEDLRKCGRCLEYLIEEVDG